ncbi:hypothetical protein ACHAW6_009381 [Cyclotella cf. meneghiniana]
MNQLQAMRILSPAFAWDHVVFATGSGGTVSQELLFMPLCNPDAFTLKSDVTMRQSAGIALGLLLAHGQLGEGHQASIGHSSPLVHAVRVCDSANYFYNTIAVLAYDMGLVIISDKETIKESVHHSIVVHQGRG